ncbi:MAG: hypothetical protein WBP64_01745 [Nitrososphaeraceae archaeon]
MILAWYFAFLAIIFFIALLVIYFLDNPVDRAYSSVNYPYILTVKPTLVGKGGIAEISLSTLSDRGVLEGISILVIGPNGNPSHLNETITKLIPFQFPTNFTDGSTLLTGNYSVLAISKITNKVLVSLSFSVLTNPWVSSFTNFIFGKGLVFTIGIIASIVPIIYQLASEETNERNTRLQNKAKWMIDNLQSFIDLWTDSKSIYSKFEDQKTKQFVYRKVDPNEILYDIIYFYKDFLVFKKKTGFYYFDDLLAEYFLAYLEDIIFDQFDKIMFSIFRNFSLPIPRYSATLSSVLPCSVGGSSDSDEP